MLPLTAEAQASLHPQARPELPDLQPAPAQVDEMNGFICWLLAPAGRKQVYPDPVPTLLGLMNNLYHATEEPFTQEGPTSTGSSCLLHPRRSSCQS